MQLVAQSLIGHGKCLPQHLIQVLPLPSPHSPTRSQFMGAARAKGREKFFPARLICGYKSFPSLFACNTHTLFSTEFSGGNPFNVAVKTSEEKLFRIVWTIKKQHKIIIKKNSLWKKNQNCARARQRAGCRGTANQPVRMLTMHTTSCISPHSSHTHSALLSLCQSLLPKQISF